jgi:hypothetical protein
MPAPRLTFEQIHEFRTSGLSDGELARKYGLGEITVHNARRGITWKDHPTPPDNVKRKGAQALTFEAVHRIRTSGLPDEVLAAEYGVTYAAVIRARRGRSWPSHPTPPDRFPRAFGGLKWRSKEQLQNAPNLAGLEPKSRDLYDRLRIRCTLDADGCWIWTGCVSGSAPRPSGHHGHTSIDGETTGTHRAMWIACYGPIPDDLCVCHQCDKPRCLHPKHLWLGTHLENMRDSIAKGRHINVRVQPNTSSGDPK